MPDVTITVPASANVDGRLASDIHAEQNPPPQLPPLGSLWQRKDGGRALVCETENTKVVYLSSQRPNGWDGRYTAAQFAAWVRKHEAVCVYPAKEGGGA